MRRYIAITLLAASCCFAQFPGETDRLMATARLWVTVEYFHPYLAYRDIDWDQALIKSIPRVRAAKNNAEFRTALSAMLDELHDPETYIITDTKITDSKGSIGGSMGSVSDATAEFDSSPQISWIHTANTSYFLTRPGTHYSLPVAARGVTLSENATLDAGTAAVAQATIKVTITATGQHYQIESTEKAFVELPGMQAVVRLSQPLKPIPIQIGGTLPPAGPPIPPAPITRPPDTHYSQPYPPTEARLLAAIKTWATIHYFFAYKDLIDEDWDDVFTTYIPKFIEARDAIDYNLTLADLLTHLTDTNTAAHSKILDTYFGEIPVGLRIRLLEKYPIITDVLDPAAKAAGVRPGDVLKRIAGVSTTDIFRRFVQYVPASTPQRSGYDTVQKVTNGPPGSEVELTIENSQGESHAVKLTRQSTPPVPQRTTDPVRILPGNIGYLDLERIYAGGVGPALDRLKDTKAIVLDLRASAAPAAASIASHLATAPNIPTVLITTPLVIHPDIATEVIATQTSSTFLVKTMSAPSQPHYSGKTIALIDERTSGEAEYAGLLFQAANKTEFVGSPSAGAYSTLTEFSLPGSITVTYSTQDIRQANGGKLQRLGIQPNVDAPTTAKGLRAAKDEALEAALAHLSR